MRRTLLAGLMLAALVGCQDQPTMPPPPDADLARRPQATHIVRMVYLVPADRAARRDHARNVESAIEHLQIWYRNEIALGTSFSLGSPVVQTVVTPHEASWYASNPVDSDPALWFWFNALADGFALTGGSFNDPDEIWVYYLDADPACGQVVGAAAGVALLPANDLRGLAGAPTISPCTGQLEPQLGVCRWIGGLGHELGHAFGLPHPPGCEAGDPSCPSNALMWFGYLIYPQAILTSEERAALQESPFFAAIRLRTKLPACTGRSGPKGLSVSLSGSWEPMTASAAPCMAEGLATALR